MTIFVNYRRDDSESITGRIDEYLRREFGNENVYRDIDSIPLGVDFVAHLETEVRKSDIFISIIGKGWLSDRLNSASDFVRIEIETALSLGIPVIPVVVEKASLPNPEQLPPTLAPLLNRNGIKIESGKMFRAQMDQLIKGIQQLQKQQTTKQTLPKPEYKQNSVVQLIQQSMKIKDQRKENLIKLMNFLNARGKKWLFVVAVLYVVAAFVLNFVFGIKI